MFERKIPVCIIFSSKKHESIIATTVTSPEMCLISRFFSKSCYNMISPVVYVVKVEQQNDVVTRYTPLQSIVSINLQLSI